jgi:hypothetical protein
MAAYFWSSISSTDPTVGANWTKSDGTTGTAPGNGDDVYVEAVPGLALASIGASDMSSVTLNSLTISQTFTGTIGTTATTGTFGYWKIGASTWTIGTPSADGTAYGGSGRIKLDFGSAAYVGTVMSSGTSIDGGLEPVRIKGSNAANRLMVLSGPIGVATNLPGETSTISEVDASGSNAVVDLGSGVTWTTATVADGATLTTASGSSGSLSIGSGATANTFGTGAIATINAGGAASLNHRPASGAAVTTLNLYPTGSADFSQNPLPVTVTTLNHYGGGALSVNPANPGQLTIGSYKLVNAGTLTAA